MSETATSPSADEIAAAVARQLSVHGSTPVVRASTSNGGPLGTGTGVTGSFDLDIVYNTTTYTLTITIPTGSGQPYVFSLTETPSGGSPSPIAVFKFLDEKDWTVSVGLPRAITIGGITIQKLDISVQDGTVS